MRAGDQGETGAQSLHELTLLGSTACTGHSTLPLLHNPTRQAPLLDKEGD